MAIAHKMTTSLETAEEVVLRLGYDTAALRFVLSRTWPFPDGQDPHNISGLDCTLVVMRHVLAHASVLDSGLPQGLREDALTILCLRDFTGDTPQKRAQIQEERVSAFDGIRKTGHPRDLKFRTLIKHTSLWEVLRADPYQPVLLQQPGSAEWVLATGTSHYRPPSIRWLTADHNTLQAAVDASYGLHKDDAGVTSALFGAAPVFLSVLFAPTGAHDVDFGIESVAEIALRRHLPMPTTAQNGVIFEDVGTDRYRLIAVVRMRTPGPHEHDYVRLYDIEGNNILPLGDRSRYAGVLDDTWPLADQDRCCMLFYVRVDHPAPEGGIWIEEVHNEEADNRVTIGDSEQPQDVHAQDAQTPKTPNKRPLPPLMSS